MLLQSAAGFEEHIFIVPVLAQDVVGLPTNDLIVHVELQVRIVTVGHHRVLNFTSCAHGAPVRFRWQVHYPYVSWHTLNRARDYRHTMHQIG